MKTLDQQLQNLALKTKMASGIWPPKNSELEMIEAAILTAKTTRDVIMVSNALHIFKTLVDNGVCCSILVFFFFFFSFLVAKI